jgi:hypothetical protein
MNYDKSTGYNSHYNGFGQYAGWKVGFVFGMFSNNRKTNLNLVPNCL